MVSLACGISPCSILMRGGAQGKFNPAVYGTLLGAWYADTGITLDSGKVSSWAPAFGTAGALAQATSAQQPTVGARSDGKAKLIFSGAQALCSALQTEAEAEIALVFSWSHSVTSKRAFALRSASAATATGNVTGLDTIFISTVSPTFGIPSPGAQKVTGVLLAKTGGNHLTATSLGATSVASTTASILVRDLCLGAHSSDGAAGMSGSIDAVWAFRGITEANLTSAVAKMISLYPEVA